MADEIHFPPAFENRMREQLGNDWPAFASTHQTSSPVSIRVNSKKRNPFIGDTVPWTSTGFYLPERPSFTLDPLFHAGTYYVQEASSMFVERALKQSTDLTQPLRVLDLCAAPGGKSTHLLSLISEDSFLVSNEVIRSRASVLGENISKWGNPNVIVTNSDPEAFENLQGFFDVVVVDAPCSGEGLFRRDPSAMNEWSEDNVKLCAARQQRILHHIWPTLKQNGVLIYSTCTYNKLENEENLKWLNDQYNAEFIDVNPDPLWGIERISEGNTLGFRFFPHRLRGEGFFISAIRKTGTQKEARVATKKKIFSPVPKKTQEQISSWIKGMNRPAFRMFNDNILLLPENHVDAAEFLSSNLHIIQCGTTMGTLKHEKIVPEHPSALSIYLNKENFQSYEASKEEALAYLRKETVMFEGLEKGFTLLNYESVPLGWMNVIGGRINNLYPANWRIRN